LFLITKVYIFKFSAGCC